MFYKHISFSYNVTNGIAYPIKRGRPCKRDVDTERRDDGIGDVATSTAHVGQQSEGFPGPENLDFLLKLTIVTCYWIKHEK